MKICFLLSDISHTGGIERVSSILAQQLLSDEPNLTIDIVSQFQSSNKIWYSFKGCELKYISKRSFNAKPHSIKRLVRILSNIRNIRTFFSKNKYDIIIAQAFPNTFMLYLSGISLKNVIAVEHVYYDYYNQFIKKIRNHVYKQVGKVVVLSKNALTSYRKDFPENKVVIIPNPIKIKKTFRSPLEAHRAIAVGRLEYQKGFDTLIEVFNDINKKYPNWILDVYGEGTLRQTLQQQIENYQLQNTIFLRGRTDNIPDKLRKSSFLIVSSRFEGFCMVIIEAMEQGVPSVAFDCPDGPSDIITNYKDGILVTNQDKQQLYNAICYMIEHEEKRKAMGLRSTKTVWQYNSENISTKWMQLFKDIQDSIL